MQRDDLVAQDVVARLDVGRDLDEPREAIRHHHIVRPVTGAGRATGGDFSRSIDLEELESGLVDSLTRAIAWRQIVEDWAMVRVRPCVPGKRDGVAGRNTSMAASWFGVPMAYYIWCTEGYGLNVSKVCLCRCPTYHSRWVRLVGEDCWVVALVGCTIYDNVLDEAVSGNSARKYQKARYGR